jgi:uncharacterized protein (DUF849 family)
MLIQVALNGSRRGNRETMLPLTPEQQAQQARAAVIAGAGAIHVHVYDPAGRESLAPTDVNATLGAIRQQCPTTPLGISTAAWIVPDLDERLAAVDGWESLPDYASVNFHEAGASAVAERLLEKGVGVEAGIWHRDAAEIYVASALLGRCYRLLLELTESTLPSALAQLDAIEAVLHVHDRHTSRLLHGEGVVAWPLVSIAAQRGYDTRVGLEDMQNLPHGAPTADNAVLVAAAWRLVNGQA